MWPGDEIGFTVIWTDWAIQAVDVHVAKRGKLGMKMSSKLQHRVWEPPSHLHVPASGGEKLERSAVVVGWVVRARARWMGEDGIGSPQ